MSVRSGFEAKIYIDLTEEGVEFEYEKESYDLWLPERRGRYRCLTCSDDGVAKRSVYTPDFFLKNGIVIETKGRFTALDRKKAVAMKTQWPNVDYRLVFMRDNTLTRSSRTRYTEWSDKQGIPAAVGRVPRSWTTGET